MSDSSIPCGACGAANSANSSVCVRCGALLAAYQTAPDSTPSAEKSVETPSPGPKASEPPDREPAGAADAIFGEHEIELKPIIVEPLAFDPDAGDPVVEDDFLRPAYEPIEAEFREKSQAAAPPKPAPEQPRPIATATVPRPGGPDSEFPADRDEFGAGPLPVRVVFWRPGRTPGCILGVAILTLVIACSLLIVLGGHQSDVLALIGFCMAFVAVLGIAGALIVWVRRKLAR